MLEPFEYKGIWWLPDKPEEQISGTLKFDPFKGARLELDNLIDAPEMSKTQKAPIILGFSLTPIPSIDFTLLGCYCPEIFIPEFYVDYIFMGTHFQNPEDIKFKNVSVKFQYLYEWAGVTGLEIERPSEKECLIRYKPPDPIEAEINNELKILIGLDKYITSSRKEIGIKEDAEIKIEPPEEKPLKYYLDKIDKIQKFLALATTKPVTPIEIRGVTELHKTEINGKTYHPLIGIYYKIPNIPNIPKEIFSSDMLFTLKDIAPTNRLGELLKTWFEKVNTEQLRPVCELYFGALYSPSIYLEHKFLSFIQALETYHRRKSNGEYLPKGEYCRLVYDKLIECIDSLPNEANKNLKALKSRLKEYLKYGNEFSLRKRLKELFEEHQVILDEMTEDELRRLKIKDKKEFIDNVVDVRNFLVHRDKELESKVSGIDLRLLTQELELLIRAILLKEIGIEEPKIEEIIEKKIKFYRDNLIYIEKFKL